MDIFDQARRERIRQNIAEKPEVMTKESQLWQRIDPGEPFNEIMLQVAMHGRIRVRGFGLFEIKEYNGRYKTHRDGRVEWIPGRRHINFGWDINFRDMCNRDYNGEQVQPEPNPEYWKGFELKVL